MKRIIVAPDSFKESLRASEAAEAIAAGFQRVYPGLDIVKMPVSDGGEGLVQTLVDGTGGRLMESRVTGPLGRPVQACWGLLDDGKTCVIEMAAASGLPLVPVGERNPTVTTTYGTGELIGYALATNCRRIIVGIGGSATNDGGAGMAQALGAQLLDNQGRPIGYGAEGLSGLSRIDITGLDPRLADVEIVVAADVTNPLCGPTGASFVYAPQKGAPPEKLPVLDDILRRFGEIVKRDLQVDVLDFPGGGAAGGLGAGLRAFLGAQARAGIDVVLDVLGMALCLEKGVDLVVTGEGEINRQTVFGKAAAGVAALAKKHSVPVVALVGSVGEGAAAVHDCGIDAFFSLTPGPMTLDQCMTGAQPLLSDIAEQCARMILALRVER